MAEAKSPRVLLVEDNEVNQAVAIAILTRLGYHADVVGDGQQAVEQVTRRRYGLVLMDCQLPVWTATRPRSRSGAARDPPDTHRSSR
jgi:CheY-like chemotaxis protein